MARMRPKKLIVFGSGFISRFIVSAALDDGIEPTVIYNRHPLKDIAGVEQFSLPDIDLTALLSRINPSYIVALQGISFVPDNKHLIQALEANFLATLTFMEHVKALVQEGNLSPQKVVLVGSAAEYGKSYLEPIAETFPLYPTSIYGLTKIYLYNTAMYYRSKGLPVVYTRQFNCTGPYQRADFVIPSICRQVAMIEKGSRDCLMIGDTKQERDFVDVRDAAQAYLMILERGVAGEVYNVGSGHAVSIDTVLEKVVSMARVGTKTKLDIKSNEKLFVDKDALSNRICANVAKLAGLGFRPKFTLDDTIKDTLEFWRTRV